MTPAKITHATTGNARTLVSRECRTGRIQRRRVAGEATRRTRVIGADQGDERRGHHRQQQVLDHVHREQRRVVAVDAGQQGEGERGQAGGERHGPASRHGIGRMRGVRRDGPPTTTRRAATAMPSVGSGSNVQPSSSVAADGGSAGTGPWAATDGRGSRASRSPPSPTSEPRPRRSVERVAIARIVARTSAGSRARRPRSGYHGAGPTLGRFGRDLLDR